MVLQSVKMFLLRMIQDFDEECVSPYHLIHRLVIVDDDNGMDHELMLHSSQDVLSHDCRDLRKEKNKKISSRIFHERIAQIESQIFRHRVTSAD